MLILRILAIQMLDSLIGSVLATVFSWEGKAISLTSNERQSVMHEVYILESPGSEISNESIVMMSSRSRICTVRVKLYRF